MLAVSACSSCARTQDRRIAALGVAPNTHVRGTHSRVRDVEARATLLSVNLETKKMGKILGSAWREAW